MYYKVYQKRKAEKFSKSFESGRDLFYSGSPNSILRFEDAVRNASTKNEEALAKVNLGTSYLAQDPIRGILLLKEVSLDQSLPDFYRAGAINYALNYYLGKKDVDFAEKHIFTGDQWQTFLVGEGREAVELAVRKTYEWSADIFSTFTAEYRIAWWYAKQINTDKTTGDAANNYVEIIREHIARGDIALASAIRIGKTPRSQFGLAYILKGIALEGIFELNQAKEIDVRTAYNQAITILDADPNDFQARGQVLYARYHLAALLARSVKPDTNEIMSILEPIYKITNAPFYQFLREERDAAIFGTDPTRKDIINLANIDPKFKERLIMLGWQEQDFK